MVYLYNGILLSNKKEEASDMHNIDDLTDITLSRKRQTQSGIIEQAKCVY